MGLHEIFREHRINERDIFEFIAGAAVDERQYRNRRRFRDTDLGKILDMRPCPTGA